MDYDIMFLLSVLPCKRDTYLAENNKEKRP